MTTQILLPLHTWPDGNAENLSRHAVTVAKYLGGTLHTLTLLPEFPRNTGPFGNVLVDTPASVAEARSKCRAHGEALAKTLATVAETAGVTVKSDVREALPATMGDVIAERARYYDLTLMGLGRDDPYLRGSAELAIFGSGRPVLLLPEDVPALTTPSHVMVAWDGSRVASRAVADAMPMLKRATKVTVAIVVDEKILPETQPGETLLLYLAAHGIVANISRIQGKNTPIADTLQNHAVGNSAGLLVMGGFGHSRMRDFVLGGATRGILRDLKVPTQVSH